MMYDVDNGMLIYPVLTLKTHGYVENTIITLGDWYVPEKEKRK